jgi:hypothetical protein
MDQRIIKTKENKKESKEEEKREISWAKELELPVGFDIVLAKIKEVQDAPLFDLETFLPLEEGLALKATKDLEKLQKQVTLMKSHYDSEKLKENLQVLGEVQQRLKAISEQYALTVHPRNERERWFERYALYMIDEGILADKEYAVGAQKLLEKPTDIEHNYAVIKKLVGEYLSRAVMARELTVDEELAKALSEEGIVLKVGASLYDRIMKNIFILQLVPMDESFKDGVRYGRIEGRSDVYGYVIGELDCVFVLIDSQTTKYLPTIILEAKGGALSSAAVSKQKAKEEDRLDLVREKPGQYALATRAQLNKGPFKDISNKFDLSHPALESDLPAILTIGPEREGEHQFDIQLNIKPLEVTLLARYLVYTQKYIPRKFED